MKIFGREVNFGAMAQITEGDAAYERDNYSLAISKYTNAISLDSSNYYPIMRRGMCYKMIKEYDKAILDLLNAKKIDNNFEINQTIAECYLFKNEFLKAIDYFEIALVKIKEIERIDSINARGVDYAATKARLLNNLAVCYLKSNQINEAISTATNGIIANPNYPNNYGIRGIAYLQVGEIAKGKSDLQRAADLGDVRSQMLLNQL